MKGYTPGDIEASAKMVILFCILEESMALGDRVLVFSQSLFTLNLVEDFLQKRNIPGKPEKWAKNWTYYRKYKYIYLSSRLLTIFSKNLKSY